MSKFFEILASVLRIITFRRVFATGLLILFCLLGYLGYTVAPKLNGLNIFSEEKVTSLTQITPQGEEVIEKFMRRYTGKILYLTILKFEFTKNLRIPIYRSFNSPEIEKLVMGRLNGNDGRLPIFILNDSTNNDEMINVIQGAIICNPFNYGGLSRVWPDLDEKLLISCRVPIPPSAGGDIRGYIVVHIGKPMTTFELESLKLDLIELSRNLNKVVEK